MIIQSRRVWQLGKFVPLQLLLSRETGRIERVLPYGARACDLDYGTLRIIPGMIDIHTHGCYGFDTNDAEPEGLRYWARHIPEEGVTSLLPTTITQQPDVLLRALANVAAVAAAGYEGAEILGVHFEGPYLSAEYKGAQPPEAIAAPDIGQLRRYQEAAGGLIRYITLAPEKDTDHAMIRYCTANGIVVSMGHSAADYEEVLLAAADGARSITHTYNGMSPFKHRSPGLAGASLSLHGLYGEIIADGRHSHIAALQLFLQAKGPDYGIIVSDSLRVKGCEPGGDYELGGHPIEICPDGLARLKGTDTIAGSTLRMNEALRIAAEEAQVPFETALNAVTINPARCLRVDDRKGRLMAGYDADIAVLRDDYSVAQTFCRGNAML